MSFFRVAPGVVALTFFAGGCASNPAPVNGGASVNPRIPVEDLRAVADEIERAVSEGAREPEIQNRDGIVVDTPAIRQAIRTRAIRHPYVDEFRSGGHAWERRNGRLWIIRSGEYRRAATSRERDRDAAMVIGENENRWTIYEGIIDESDLPRGSMDVVQVVFFEARLKYMAAGQKYEAEDGEVAVKE